MAATSVVKSQNYSRGRGRGILGLAKDKLSIKPGATKKTGVQDETKKEAALSKSEKRGKLLIAMHNYSANAQSPGGFTELSVKKGQLLTLCREHPDNEHWWEVRNEDDEVGFIPSSYVIIREEQSLPWLQLTSLKSEEEERKERVKRLAQEKSASEGKGFGPPPKTLGVAKPYVSAYSRSSNLVTNDPNRYYCEVCDKRLNGPKPYSAHMASRAHKDEVEALELYGR